MDIALYIKAPLRGCLRPAAPFRCAGALRACLRQEDLGRTADVDVGVGRAVIGREVARGAVGTRRIATEDEHPPGPYPCGTLSVAINLPVLVRALAGVVFTAAYPSDRGVPCPCEAVRVIQSPGGAVVEQFLVRRLEGEGSRGNLLGSAGRQPP